MNDGPMSQLDKVLALADSDQEGEALGAVRMARQILSKEGLKFKDLARVAAISTKLSDPSSLFFGCIKDAESQLISLLHRFSELQNDSLYQANQLEFWRMRAQELEQKLEIMEKDAERWRQMAKETADKLWEIGRLAAAEQPAEVISLPVKRKAASRRR